MFKPVRMKKVSAVILEDKKDNVLRELKEKGVIQLINVSSTEVFRDFELAAIPPSGIKTKASELLSRVNNILDVFDMVESKDKSILKKIVMEEPKKTPVYEVPAFEFFEDVGDKLFKIEERVLEISNRVESIKGEREELLNFRKVLSILRTFGIGPSDLFGYNTVRVIVGIAPNSEVSSIKNELYGISPGCIICSNQIDKNETALLICFQKDNEVEVVKLLRMHHFEDLKVPFNFIMLGLNEASSRVESALASLAEEEGRILDDLKKIANARREELQRIRELLQIEEYIDSVNQNFGKTVSTCILSGWVPIQYVDKAVKTIRETSEGYCDISVEDPTIGDEPPTQLSNPSVTEPLDVLTETYGSPNYNEIDPTSVIALTFPLVFGLMFGDVGQGLLLAMIGYLLGFRFKVNKAIARFGRIILYSGAFSIIMGFIYGSVFGLEIIHHGFVVSPLHDAQSLIKFVLYLGLVLFSLGCILNIFNAISNKRYFSALFDRFGLVGLWLLWGGAIMVIRHFDNLIEIFKNVYVIPAVVIPLFLIGIGEKIEKKEGLLIISISLFETMVVFMSNCISHIRIAAIAIVHASLFAVMLQIMFVNLPGSSLNSSLILFLQVLVFVFGNMVIFALEALSAFIQTTRLHYYELFSKFFRGRGESFKPFKVSRRYTVPKNI